MANTERISPLSGSAMTRSERMRFSSRAISASSSKNGSTRSWAKKPSNHRKPSRS